MTQNKRVRTNVIFTIIVFSLAAIKLIIWLVDSEDVTWVFEFPDCILMFPTFCGIFLSAFLTLITIWLPPTPKLWFGIVALLISFGMWTWELGIIGCFVLVSSFGGYSPIEELYPLLTAGVIAVLIITTVTSRKREKVPEKGQGNDS